ncbi:MAG: DUF1491 family protein [Neomegalonema sp.]|nr:DUF1491 family protein [Neomegalonema sp.]
MPPRLAAHIFVAALIRRAEIEGATALVGRRGEREAGAVAIKLIETAQSFTAPRCRALTRATLATGEQGWSWLVGPEPDYENAVDAKLAREAEFDPDLWVIEIEDREGRAFVDDPIM